MTYPPVIGITGVAGAGKDTTFERLVSLGGSRFQRFSIADPMKESIAALFNVSLDRLEELKRDPDSFVKLGGRGELARTGFGDNIGGYMARHDAKLTVREFMQRYGTEAHRGVFGEDFWLEHWLRQVDARQRLVTAVMGEPCVFVNTSVRFPNEAMRILDLAGEVWSVTGPQDDGAAGHESETPLPPSHVTRYIDNSIRTTRELSADTGGCAVHVPDHSHLDDQVALILDEWRNA